MARPERKHDQEPTAFDDLRVWLQQVEEIGQLERISGAHWDLEVGALNEIVCERSPTPPALLFENVAGHKGQGRVLANMMETMERTALTLGLPLDLSTIEVIDRLRTRLASLVPVEPRVLPTGPVMENRKTGKDIDILDIPVPRWHSGDGGRYLGTAHLVVTRDPETGEENVGCYRVMVHEGDKLALYISPGKHGRMHMEKSLKAGKPVQVAMAFGQHPLMFVAASQAVPPGGERVRLGRRPGGSAPERHRGAAHRPPGAGRRRDRGGRGDRPRRHPAPRGPSASGPATTPAPAGPSQWCS